MEVERKEQVIVVSLSADEVLAVQAGRTVGDRPSIISPGSKIEVVPLSAVQEDKSLRDKWEMDRLERGLKAPLKGNLFPNGDLQVIIPAITLSDVRITRANLPREAIETPMTEDRKGYLLRAIPNKGITVNFGGSLQVVDVGAENY